MIQWRVIDDDPPKGEVLLYFPSIKNDRYGHGALSPMFYVGYISQFPHRRPTHWTQLKPPEASS